ncbi:hypothetical protein PRIPAC_79866 [Pristionchus pacificus]|uniref:Anaphase-promoting complex subunit 3 protein n=1 Tax=Pristionchus pacificus TaxID=54126 RepID=A0A2A6BY66_PRIPA|nr:hypothetical protein PRIPAC_79866 [Pristionchus pacificus]|eukprot:PDM70952.1 Anaphase-promoting complex subunit 3 protein [Pristionchus pacificus]
MNADECKTPEGRGRHCFLAYREALRASSNEENEDDADLKYRIAKCLYLIGGYEDAMGVLNQIRHTNVKARMKKLEIDLWEKMGINDSKSKDPILEAHQAVVACCTYSVTSLKYLARRRDRKRIDSLIAPPISDLSFLTPWWNAQIAWGHGDLLGAVTSLIHNSSIAPRIAYREAGEMLFYIGMKEDAVEYLLKSYRLDSNNKDGLSLLVNALGQLAVDEVERLEDLEGVVLELSGMRDNSADALLAYGQLARVREVRRKEETNNSRSIKHEVPLHFSHKAFLMDVKNKSDATLLKMQILNDIERYEELLEIGTSLLGRDPYNIDVYEQMVSANIVLKRGEGARLLALSALKEIPGPRSALLYAHVLSLKSESSQDKGTEELRKVVHKYPYFIDAAVILADALVQREIFDEAIIVLKGVIQKVPFVHRVVSGQLTKTLSECQMRQNEYIAAYHNMHRSVVS